jgi:hypothetical protein
MQVHLLGWFSSVRLVLCLEFFSADVRFGVHALSCALEWIGDV